MEASYTGAAQRGTYPLREYSYATTRSDGHEMKSFRKEDVVGKTVIETSGTVKGKVTDLTFDLNGNITFVVEGDDGKESRVAVSKVTGISDHVIVKSDQPIGETGGGGGSTTCKFCGASKPANSVWCPSCGKSQV